MQKTDLSIIYLCGIIGMLALSVRDKVNRGLTIQDVFSRHLINSKKTRVDFVIPDFTSYSKNDKQKENNDSSGKTDNFTYTGTKKFCKKNSVLKKRKGLAIRSFRRNPRCYS